MIEGASVIEVDLATTLTVEPVDETKKAQLVDSLGEAGALKQGTSGPRKRPNRVDMIGPDCRAKVFLRKPTTVGWLKQLRRF